MDSFAEYCRKGILLQSLDTVAVKKCSEICQNIVRKKSKCLSHAKKKRIILKRFRRNDEKKMNNKMSKWYM